jgi:hypothetical protein
MNSCVNLGKQTGGVIVKKAIILFLMMIAIVSAASASDYQGVEKQDSIFQKLGDLLTGKYEVEKGKTLKEKGVVQLMADQVKDIKTGPTR